MITQTGSVVGSIVPCEDGLTTSQTAIKEDKSCYANISYAKMKIKKLLSTDPCATSMLLSSTIASVITIIGSFPLSRLNPQLSRALYYTGLGSFGVGTLISGFLIGKKIYKIENFQSILEFANNNKVLVVSALTAMAVGVVLTSVGFVLVLNDSNFLKPLIDAGLTTFDAGAVAMLASIAKKQSEGLLQEEENEITMSSEEESDEEGENKLLISQKQFLRKSEQESEGEF